MRIKNDTIALLLFLSVPLFSFLFDSIINKPILVDVVLLSVLLFSRDINTKRIIIEKDKIVWLLYVGGIILGLIHSVHDKRVLGRTGNFILFIFIMVLVRFSFESIELGLRLIFAFGIFNALAIYIQFIFGEKYNEIIFSFFSKEKLEIATNYFNNGYYSGINHEPYITAGMLSLALGMIFIELLLNNVPPKQKALYIVALFALFYALLLTGKKGILISSLFSAFVLYVYVTGKKWRTIIAIVLIAPVIFLLIRYAIGNMSDIKALYRIIKFFNQLEQGSGYDSGRLGLYKGAIKLWIANPLLGIGWLRFVDYSTSMFGYSSPHYVNLDYLQFLCETGMIGFVLLMTPIVITFIKMFKLLKSNGNIDNIRLKRLIVFSSYVQFLILVYALVEVPFYDRVFFFPIYIFSTIGVMRCYPTVFQRVKP